MISSIAMKHWTLGISLSIVLLASACTRGNEDQPPTEPDRPSPTATIQTEELRVQIDEVEDACVLLEAEAIKKYLAGDDYEEPQEPGRPTNTCIDRVDRSCPGSDASVRLYLYPQDSNIEAAEFFYDNARLSTATTEGFIEKSGEPEVYAAVYVGEYVADDAYTTGVYILGEFYVIRADLIVNGEECIGTVDEVGTWLFDEYAPMVVESIETRLSR